MQLWEGMSLFSESGFKFLMKDASVSFFWLTAPQTVFGHEYAVDTFCVCVCARVKDGHRKKETDTDRQTGTQTAKSSIVHLA